MFLPTGLIHVTAVNQLLTLQNRSCLGLSIFGELKFKISARVLLCVCYDQSYSLVIVTKPKK